MPYSNLETSPYRSCLCFAFLSRIAMSPFEVFLRLTFPTQNPPTQRFKMLKDECTHSPLMPSFFGFNTPTPTHTHIKLTHPHTPTHTPTHIQLNRGKIVVEVLLAQIES